MAKYHVNPATGVANPCKAVYECRYGAGMPHFTSKDEASKFFAEAMNDSTVYLYERERGRLGGVREGYLQGKLYPQDLRAGDIVQQKCTVGNTTWNDYYEIVSMNGGASVQRRLSPQNDWKPVIPLGGKPHQTQDREVSYPLHNTNPSAMVFVLREKPANWYK